MNSPSITTPDRPVKAEAQAFLALGSNLSSAFGSPAETVVTAMDEIASWSDQPLLRSSLWSSAPVDCPPGSPDFINAVVAMVPGVAETPRTLLTRMLELEQRLGRKRGAVVNAPRSLDADLICFGGLKIDEAELILPHPRAHCRSFVLLPLAEIAPDLCLPGQSRRVSELALELLDSGRGSMKIVR
jgi:2-amino-4-hydroxy-6-hydroxymethyldihydropteridine diphosphokinase